MNPYEVLGLPSTATAAEIKSSYRRLVKQFHPDVSKHKDVENKIRQLNEAYDILADPVRKATYDRTRAMLTYEPSYEEDPREVYRREYFRHRHEREQRVEGVTRQRERWIYRVMRIVTFPILAFAILLVADSFLPSEEYQEVAEVGWQESFGSSGHQNNLLSFMQTQTFTLAVPDALHLSYDYDADEKEVLTISVSPIFDIPISLSVSRDNQHYTFKVKQTVYSNALQLHYLLLASSLFIVLRKDYSVVNFSLCFVAPFILCFILLIMF